MVLFRLRSISHNLLSHLSSPTIKNAKQQLAIVIGEGDRVSRGVGGWEELEILNDIIYKAIKTQTNTKLKL